MSEIVKSLSLINISLIRITAFNNILVDDCTSHLFPGCILKFIQRFFESLFKYSQTDFIFSFLNLHKGVEHLAEREEDLLFQQECIEVIIERAYSVFHDFVYDNHDYLEVFRLEETFDQEYFNDVLKVDPLKFLF
jgi:hypothetical protein